MERTHKPAHLTEARRLLVIPARRNSTRLRDKLLLRETGRSLLQHTFEAAQQSRSADAVVIAVDDSEVEREALRFGANVVMTSPDCPSGTDRVAAVVIEPIQAEGGVRLPPDGFLAALRRRCTEVGALLVFDEVLTGFGRTGHLFAAQHWGVAPDLLVLAKALGGGMPLGAFIGTADVMATLSHDPPLAHVTTFGGHPVSCAAGLAALKVMLRDDLPARAARVGDAWRNDLATDVGGVLRAVRGRGLLIGLELETPEATRRFAHHCFANGLILNWTLHRDTVVRLAPPLTIEPAEVEHATAVLRDGLRRC